MGNSQSFPWARTIKSTDAEAMFHALDVHALGYLTLKDLMAAASPALILPHSLPALYFFDQTKNGRLSEPEFVALVHFCQTEKRKVEEAFTHDKTFRDLILRASKAGVKDCSLHGRSFYRRLSSYSKVRSVFSSRPPVSTVRTPSSRAMPPRYPRPAQQPSQPSSIPSDSSEDTHISTSPNSTPVDPVVVPDDTILPAAESSISSENDELRDEPMATGGEPQQRFTRVAMYSSQREFSDTEIDANPADSDPQDPQNCTALDAAVLENIIHANIHKLADLLHTEGCREEFMAWLWNLIDFNSSGVVTLEELRVLLAALSDDGIDLAELAFYREGGVPLEESIINEFDTTHAGMLSRDEFMVLADLVTREYEFWQNRHLERIGDYELGRTIGRGSSGVVRHAIHVETRQKVAIKIIKKGKCSDLSRLDREIQSLMAARHKNIVSLEEVLDSESNLFIVMELCGGGSMVDIVRLYPEERMPEETARFFMRQVFAALAFCHQNGICHRDVRLDNLMLDNYGKVKITDFGHSGVYTPGWDIFSTSLVGSVYNLSPEQIMGQLYSGEKIDVWSSGVAVYCLLVGRPPFFEPDVNALMEGIIACDFELPDFLSPNAKDFIKCMVRAAPEERISIQQMLHHPWFYDGPDFGPSMNVVGIPVDPFFKERPDIAEMIMAITIYQHSLHFHLADTQNPKSSPEDQRGQDWTLKCLCPKNDIKFTVSLFTKKPYAVRKKRVTDVQMTSAASMSVLTDAAAVQEEMASRLPSRSSSDMRSVSDAKLPIYDSIGDALESLGGAASTANSSMSCVVPQSACNYENESSGLRPPAPHRPPRITPMRIAAQIRDHGTSDGFDEVFDFEQESANEAFPVRFSRCDMFAGQGNQTDPFGSPTRNGRRNKHSRTQSLDGSGNLMRISRSATVDAFPYQKVYPPRKMPESVRTLNFDRPESATSGNSQESESSRDGHSGESSEHPSANLKSFHQSVSLHGAPSHVEDSNAQSKGAQNVRDVEISQELYRHPSKVISPQTPQVVRLPGLQEPGSERPDEPSQQQNDVADLDSSQGASSGSPFGMKSKVSDADFQPYIEVRLQDGESGLFLKICRKLKTICTTKLATAAERQKKKVTGRRSLSTLRRTASARNMKTDLGGEMTDLTRASSGFSSKSDVTLKS